MRTKATAKFVGTSARKTGLVAAMIRGRRATEAQEMLAFTQKRASVPVGKVLASAIANAENNHKSRATDLVVESVIIGPGPTLKRSRARAKGSSSAIRKRTSHITIIVSDDKATRSLISSKTSGTETTQPTKPTDSERSTTQSKTAAKTEEKK